MSINISLTQFLNYSSKISTSAKIKAVRDIKNAPDYHPAIDYWKVLRDEIKRIHSKGLPIENLRDIIPNLPESKIKNYTNVINTYIKFINKNNVTYFETGKSYWKLDEDLFVGCSPEIGLIINGEKLYVKNYYKKKSNDTKITQRNINSTLTLMQIAERDFLLEDSSNFAVLNLQNGKLIKAPPLVSEDILELEIDAQSFVTTWNKV
ncbi:hypothetical protein ACODH8_09815 [Vagococcus fluvialis]|uniref:hypothetical protein n=1 Tax=Vagococcus fluvialis TaxID=2738 RepID=UPI003B5A5009